MAKKVSEKTGKPFEVVMLVYKTYFDYICQRIKEVDFESINNREDCIDLPMSFNLCSIGKLYTTYERIYKINENKKIRNEHIQNKKRV